MADSSYQTTIEQLAKMVVRSNLTNYKNHCDDNDFVEQRNKFAVYGTDEETVKMIVDQLIPQVAIEAQKLQATLADIIYDD